MKKKLALGTTALAVLASVVPSHVAPVEASTEGTMSIVYTSFDSGGGNFTQKGDGSQENPFNLFEQAMEAVAPGGTIIITNKAFINDNESKSLPFYINKPVTIKSVGNTPATLDVRSGGIVLGADVTFENISLSFGNKVHDAIFANGHTLNLINVVRAGGSREVDLFAGSLYLEPGVPSLEPGDKSVINVVINGDFKGGPNSTNEFGNIYAGSMNGSFNEEAEINVTNTGSSGILKVKGIYASGAFESDPSHMLDIQEPLPPEAMPDSFPMHGNVNITLQNLFPNVDGETGSTSKTSVSTSTVNPRNLTLTNVDHLTVSRGRTNIVNSTSLDFINKVTVNENAMLSLVGASDSFTVNNYSGNGTVILGLYSSLSIENEASQGSRINLAVQDYFSNKSDPAALNHNYLVTPEGTEVAFTPHTSQPDLVIHPTKNDSQLYWKVLNRKDVPATPEPEEPSEPELPILLGFEITDEAASKTFKESDFSGTEKPNIVYSFKVATDSEDEEEEIWLSDYEDLEVTVNNFETRRVEDEDGYVSYICDTIHFVIYFEPDPETGLQKLVLLSETEDGQPVTPAPETFNIKISHPDVEDLVLTLIVEDDTPPVAPTDPEGDNGNGENKDPDGEEGEEEPTPTAPPTQEPEEAKIETLLPSDTSIYKVAYEDINKDGLGMFELPFKAISTKEGERVDLNKFSITITVNEKELTRTEDEGYASYDSEDLGLHAYFSNGESTEDFKLVICGSDADGNETVINPDNYQIKVAYDLGEGKGVTEFMNGLIVLPPETTDPGEQEPQGPNAHLSKLIGIIFAEGAHEKTYSYNGLNYSFGEQDNSIVSYVFQTQVEQSPEESTPKVNIVDYKFNFTVNGKEAEYREKHKDYYVESLGLSLHFNDFGMNTHELVVKGSDKDGNKVPIEPDKYDIVAQEAGDGVKIDVTLTVEDDQVTPEEPQPPSTGGSTGGGATVQPPSTGGSTGGGATVQPPSTGGSTTPPTTDKEEPTPKPPVVEDKVNGVENLKDLDKELQEKVDSIIADTLISENGLSLNLAGDKDDVSHVSTLEVTKDGLFATVDGEKVKFNTSLDLDNIDWDNSRVIRLNKSGDGYSAVPHKKLADGLKISSSDFGNLLIAPKVEEPFEDVDDKDWFKSDVEEMYNYGFSTGTTATTFSPYTDITRAQFAVMIARALELTPNNESKGLSDLKGKWYQDEAQALFEAGIIKGFANGTFGGEEKLTRQQAVTMIVNMLKYTGVKTEVADDIQFADLDKIGEHAQDAVKYLVSQDVLVNGEGVNFNPYNNITRAQMAKVLVRSLHLTDLY